MTDIARLQHLARSGDLAAADALALAYRRGARPALPPLPPSVCEGGADAGKIMGAMLDGFINVTYVTWRLRMYCALGPLSIERCAQQGAWTTPTQTPRRQTDHITLRSHPPIIRPPRRLTITDLS